VRGNADVYLPAIVGEDKVEREQHTMTRVYGEMLLEICFAYSTLPDPRSLELDEIAFFYNGLRPSLRKRNT